MKRRKNSKSNLDMGQEVADHEPLNCVASMDCLPDDLLVQILSFLPTKVAVSTSLLSKRWRTLFAFTKNVDFDDFIFRYRRNIKKSFDNFVDRRLAFQGVNHLKNVSMKLREEYKDKYRIDRWICNALEHGLSELHLEIHIESMSVLKLPSKNLTTLVKLSLVKLYIESFPSDISLPALKVLLLDCLWMESDQVLDVLLAGCSALEDLTMNDTSFLEASSYVISSKTIKKLSVTYNYFVISLDTPNVVDLYYSHYARRQYLHYCNLDSLAKATLNLNSIDDKKRDSVDLTDLISGICNVKTLHLTSYALEVISVCCKGGLPVFKNLTNLVVLSFKKQGLRDFLPLMLERSPNLKTMVLSGLEHNTFRGHRFVGIQIPLSNQIKMRSIKEYRGSEDDLEHISYFLLKMKCLEVVKVYVSSGMNGLNKMQLREDLLKLPAASSRLKIQVI